MLLAVATICVLIGATVHARLLRLTGLDAVVGLPLLAVAQVTLLSLLLAVASSYSAAALTAGAAAVAALSLAAACATGRGGPRWWFDWPRWRVRRPRTVVEWLTALLLLLVVVHVSVRFVLAVRLAPYGYDALSYHLAAVGWLVQDGQLPGPETGGLISGYPLGGEVLAAWPATLLRSDALSSTPQLFTALLGGAATTGLSRAVGATRAASLAAGCLFVLTPALLAQTTTAYVDVTAATFGVVSISFLVRWAALPDDGSGRLFMAGLAGGLGVGVKPTAVLLVGTCLIAVLLVALRRRDGVHVGSAVLTFAVPATLAGGGWYLKNYLVHGNPVYPVAFAGLPGETTVGGLLTPAPGPALPEPFPTLWSWAHDVLPQTAFTYEQRGGGLGTVFVWIGLPCLVLAVVRAVRHRDPIWALLFLLCVIPFVLQPYRWWARFTFVLAALAAVAIASVLSSSPSCTRGAGRMSRLLELIPGGVAVAVLVVQPALFARAVMPTDGGPPVAAWQAFSVPEGDRLSGGPERPDWLEGVEKARVVAVAVEEIARTGSLFGPRFEREVHPVDTGDATAFARSLSGADVLVACRRSEIGRWAEQDPEHLQLLSDPRSELAVWQISGTPTIDARDKSRPRAPAVYCD